MLRALERINFAALYEFASHAYGFLIFTFLLMFPWLPTVAEPLAWTGWLLAIFFRGQQPTQARSLRLNANLGGFFLIIFLLIGIYHSLSGQMPSDHLAYFRWIPALWLCNVALAVFPPLNGKIFALLASLIAVAGLYVMLAHGIDLSLTPEITSPIIFPWANTDSQTTLREMSHALAMGCSALFAMHLLLGKFQALHRSLTITAIIIVAIALTLSNQITAWFSLATGMLAISWMTKRASWVVCSAILLVSIAWTQPFVLGQAPPPSSQASAIMGERELLNQKWSQLESNWALGSGHWGLSDQLHNHGFVSNLYIEILGTTGVIGFACFMLFLLCHLSFSTRMFKEIPGTHVWHRAFLGGTIAAQICFLTSALYSWNLMLPMLMWCFVLSLAISTYLSRAYTYLLVSDDHSL